MALRSEIVDFVGLRLLQETDQVCRTRHVPAMQDHVGMVLMGILIEVVDALGIPDQRGSPLQAMHHVALGKQQFGKQRAILAGDACDECRAPG
ncbi:hypothetical protein X733_32745 [Mesorhizobium sp. L2C067A000]|nr:hypothetical protein X733_32745 [Mesorhizobium sp. L2C067A000]